MCLHLCLWWIHKTLSRIHIEQLKHPTVIHYSESVAFGIKAHVADLVLGAVTQPKFGFMEENFWPAKVKGIK